MYETLFKDNNINVGRCVGNYEHFLVTKTDNDVHDYLYFGSNDRLYWDLNFRTHKDIINYCIESIKKIINKEPKYIPTIMRLIAFRETL